MSGIRSGATAGISVTIVVNLRQVVEIIREEYTIPGRAVEELSSAKLAAMGLRRRSSQKKPRSRQDCDAQVTNAVVVDRKGAGTDMAQTIAHETLHAKTPANSPIHRRSKGCPGVVNPMKLDRSVHVHYMSLLFLDTRSCRRGSPSPSMRMLSNALGCRGVAV